MLLHIICVWCVYIMCVYICVCVEYAHYVCMYILCIYCMYIIYVWCMYIMCVYCRVCIYCVSVCIFYVGMCVYCMWVYYMYVYVCPTYDSSCDVLWSGHIVNPSAGAQHKLAWSAELWFDSVHKHFPGPGLLSVHLGDNFSEYSVPGTNVWALPPPLQDIQNSSL